MLCSRVLIFLSCIVCSYAALGQREDYEGKEIAQFNEGDKKYIIFLSFTPKKGSKIFINKTARKIVFWDPHETTVKVEPKEQIKKDARLFNNAKDKLYISFDIEDHEDAMYRMPGTIFVNEGVYTFSQTTSCNL